MAELSDEQRALAAAGDLNVFAVLMMIGSIAFTIVNLVIGSMGWIAAALTILSTSIWAVGLLRRSPAIAAFVKIGLGFGGIAAPVVALAGLVFALVGQSWGWVVVAGGVAYFVYSLLGLEILERAETYGVVAPFEP